MTRTGAGLRSLRVGYVPLVDCAPLVAAVRLGLDHRHGLRLELLRQGSWAAVRDKLLSGELDASHALAGMVYGIETGIGGPRGAMAVLMATVVPWTNSRASATGTPLLSRHRPTPLLRLAGSV